MDLRKKNSTACSHLIVFAANSFCSDQFVSSSIIKLIANSKITHSIHRYTLVDLSDTTWLTRLRSEVDSIQYAVLLLWDSQHPVPAESVDQFRVFLATTVSHIVPVFLWVLVSAELVQHRKRRKLAKNRLKTACQNSIFKSFEQRTVYRLQTWLTDEVQYRICMLNNHPNVKPGDLTDLKVNKTRTDTVLLIVLASKTVFIRLIRFKTSVQLGTRKFNCGLRWLRRWTSYLLHTAKKKGPRIVIQ